MNEREFRLRLIDAWSKGYIKLDEDSDVPGFWGFTIAQDFEGDIEDHLAVSIDWYERVNDYDEVSIAVAKEIANFPLVKALS